MVLSPGMEFFLNLVIIGYIPLIVWTVLLGIGLGSNSRFKRTFR